MINNLNKIYNLVLLPPLFMDKTLYSITLMLIKNTLLINLVANAKLYLILKNISMYAIMEKRSQLKLKALLY